MLESNTKYKIYISVCQKPSGRDGAEERIINNFYIKLIIDTIEYALKVQPCLHTYQMQ